MRTEQRSFAAASESSGKSTGGIFTGRPRIAANSRAMPMIERQSPRFQVISTSKTVSGFRSA